MPKKAKTIQARLDRLVLDTEKLLAEFDELADEYFDCQAQKQEAAKRDK